MNKTIYGFAGVLLISAVALSGCSTGKMTAQETKRGLGYGALTGAVSGFFWGILSGNPIQGAAEGAFVGAGTGAVVGGIHGSSKELELKREYGEVNYHALEALAHRNYPAARDYAAQTADDPNPQYRHASAWISAIIAKETLGNDAMEPFYEKLIEVDADIESREDARVEVRLAQRELKALRKQFGVR